MEKFLYLIINLGALFIPFLFSFHTKIKFNKHYRAALSSISLTTIFFLLWDIPFTQNGVWGFSEMYTLGIDLFGLPIEEVMFFYCILYACLFTYFCIQKFWIGNDKSNAWSYVSYLGGTVLIVTSLFVIDQVYTFTCFFTTGIALLVLTKHFYYQNHKAFWLSYLILLIPFFIVNGLLTGFSLQEPVVWYNNAENFGIRIVTIPIEDSIYALEMIALCVSLFEYFKRRFATL